MVRPRKYREDNIELSIRLIIPREWKQLIEQYKHEHGILTTRELFRLLLREYVIKKMKGGSHAV